jgi:hypothetical protein
MLVASRTIDGSEVEGDCGLETADDGDVASASAANFDWLNSVAEETGSVNLAAAARTESSALPIGAVTADSKNTDESAA